MQISPVDSPGIDSKPEGTSERAPTPFTTQQKALLDSAGESIDHLHKYPEANVLYHGETFHVETSRIRGYMQAGANVSILNKQKPDQYAYYSSDQSGSGVGTKGMTTREADEILGLAVNQFKGERLKTAMMQPKEFDRLSDASKKFPNGLQTNRTFGIEGGGRMNLAPPGINGEKIKQVFPSIDIRDFERISKAAREKSPFKPVWQTLPISSNEKLMRALNKNGHLLGKESQEINVMPSIDIREFEKMFKIEKTMPLYVPIRKPI